MNAEGLVDDARNRGVGTVVRDRRAVVHDERRRTAPGSGDLRLDGLDLGVVRSVVHARVELVQVLDADADCDCLEAVLCELARVLRILVGVEPVVVGPELVLVRGTERGIGGVEGLGGPVGLAVDGQEVVEDDLYLAGRNVVGHDLGLDVAGELPACRALEVLPQVQRVRRVGVTERPAVRRDGRRRRNAGGRRVRSAVRLRGFALRREEQRATDHDGGDHDCAEGVEHEGAIRSAGRAACSGAGKISVGLA